MPDDKTVLVDIDASLFTEDASIGHITGSLRFHLIPNVGDAISFTHPDGDGTSSLIGTIRVEHRTLYAGATYDPALSLSDITVKTKAEAFRVARYLETQFDLFANIHDEQDLRDYLNQDTSAKADRT